MEVHDILSLFLQEEVKESKKQSKKKEQEMSNMNKKKKSCFQYHDYSFQLISVTQKNCVVL